MTTAFLAKIQTGHLSIASNVLYG